MQKGKVPTFKLGSKLTAEHLPYFKENGIFHFKNFISRERVAEFLGEIEGMQSELVKMNISKVNGIPLKFGTDINTSCKSP